MKIKYSLLLFAILLFTAFRTNTLIDQHPLNLFLPADLKAELWAESPMLYNPSNIDTDYKGRIWVTEAVNYRNFNNDSTQFVHHPNGDRVVILSDNNGDGKADESKVFVQDKDLVSPLGIAVIGNEIYVSCAPHIIKYTDINGDDRPDKKEIFLTGFGTKDHDHSIHCIVAGPDGNYYFNAGNAGPHQITDKSGFTIRAGSLYSDGSPYNKPNAGKQISDDGHIWVGGLQLKIKPDGTQMKVLAHNFRNSYETYIDGHGDMWQNDNDDQVVTCRVSWLAEGGNAGYFCNDGTRYWSADQRPGQDMFTAHWHQADPAIMPAGDNSGAGSPTGMLRIEGTELGQKYLGFVLSADAGRNMIFSYQPHKTGSGYNLAGLRSNFVSSLASDNQAYQWSDKKFESDQSKWFRPSDMVIGADGALYIADWYDAVVGGHQMKDKTGYGRIYRISPKNKVLAQPNLNFETLKGQLKAFKNPAVNVRNKAYLALKAGGQNNFTAIANLCKDANPFTKSRALWLMSQLGKKGATFLQNKLKTGSENEKIVALRALRSVQNSAAFLQTLESIKKEKSSFVRREAIVALEKYSFIQKQNLLTYWSKNTPLNDSFYLNAIALALDYNTEKFYEINKNWLTANTKYFNLVFTLHPSNSLAYFTKIIENEKQELTLRNKALTAVGFINTIQAVEYMNSLKNIENVSIKNMASYWLAFRSTNDWLELHDWTKDSTGIAEHLENAEMLKYKERILNEYVAIWDRQNSVNQMIKSEIGSQLLIEMLRKNQLSTDLIENAKTNLLNHNNNSIKYQAQKYIENIKVQYTEAEILGTLGSTDMGQQVFQTSCTNCHKLGNTGATIGPDLSKIGSKLDKTGLIEALTKPSNSIVFGYETSTFETNDGKSFYGILIAENSNSLTIKDLNGKKTTINQENIVSRKKETGSIMPSPSALNLTAKNLSDLIAYLETLK